MTVSQYATSLGATVKGGINWAWATWPATDALADVKADLFESWCLAHDYETRGVYPPTKPTDGYGVRFR